MKRWDTIQMRSEFKRALQILYEEDKKKPTNQKFNAWLDERVKDYVEYMDRVRCFGLFLEITNVENNRIDMYDHRNNEPITVWIDTDKKILRCGKHKRIDCSHVGYCFADQMIYKTLIDRGFKNQKVNSMLDDPPLLT